MEKNHHNTAIDLPGKRCVIECFYPNGCVSYLESGVSYLERGVTYLESGVSAKQGCSLFHNKGPFIVKQFCLSCNLWVGTLKFALFLS